MHWENYKCTKWLLSIVVHLGFPLTLTKNWNKSVIDLYLIYILFFKWTKILSYIIQKCVLHKCLLRRIQNCQSPYILGGVTVKLTTLDCFQSKFDVSPGSISNTGANHVRCTWTGQRNLEIFDLLCAILDFPIESPQN